ncbi:MAG: DUF192 domain-containing protein [Proteobacteria bacterium]|nr:DUF192 domain-containing protein [Pseudomonadota bacterium]HQR03486.1 DUF192 domain-containing protein [Rhodocyclaceae bacterium]
MKQGALYRAGNATCLLPRVWKTASAWERMRGLLGRPPLSEGQGFLIDPCPSVHTFGMGYPLDLVFLGPDYRILKQVSRLPPWRLAGCGGARATLELPPGSLTTLRLGNGEALAWRAA